MHLFKKQILSSVFYCLVLGLLSACNSDSFEASNTTLSKSTFDLGNALNQADIQTLPFIESKKYAQKVPSSNTGGWSIDTNNRQLVRSFYNSVYLASENTEMDWTGDQNTCNAGTTSSDFKNSILARINYYRAMAGVPATITLNSTYNDKAQQSALMMSANNALSHNPPTTWDCYTADGAQAAGSSNISIGNNGWDAVDGQMRDNGSNNDLVGHRRWLLFPQTQQMGTGDVPKNGTYNKANDVWVFDGNSGNARPTTRDDFVAWPTTGFNPFQVVPTRWSFSYPGANFSNATVTMTQGSSSVAVTIDNNSATGYGENTIIWHPSSMSTGYNSRWPKPTQDTEYQVTISNVNIAGVNIDYNYSVTIIDPQTALTGEESSFVSGNTAPAEDASADYTFSSMSLAEAYDVIIAEISSNLISYDAEDSGVSVTDETDASYTLIYSGSGTNGTSVYRLAPATTEEVVEFPDVFIPSATGSISFDSKLGYATDEQTATFQVSTDDGASWSDIYSLKGTNGLAETNFSNHSISLADYANSFVKFRAKYSHTGFQYSGTNANVSFLIDKVQLSNSTQVVSQTVINEMTVNNFSFIPQSGKDYALAVGAILWTDYPALAWGNLFYVSPIVINDNDNDGISDVNDSDDDNDMMPDVWELEFGFDPFSDADASMDADGDNVTNLNEYLEGTNPLVINGLYDVLNKAEIAKLIIEAKYGNDFVPANATGLVYIDVLSNDFNAAWIEKLASDGITEGCNTNLYCPNSTVTNEQLAKMILKAVFGSSHSPTNANGLVFVDVVTDTFAARWIEDLFNQSFTEGCTDNKFCPTHTATFETFEKIKVKAFP